MRTPARARGSVGDDSASGIVPDDVKFSHARVVRQPNVTLQSLVYFNILYSIVFAVVMFATLLYRHQRTIQPSGMEIAVPIVFALWAIAEVARLNFGYTGNLREQVAELSAFLLLTAFPQLPALVFICFARPEAVPSDTALGYVMLCFMAVELWVSYRTLTASVRRRREEFVDACVRHAA